MNTSRRNFLKASAAFGGLMVLPSWAASRKLGPNDKLNVAVVGVGGRGRDSVNAIAGSPNAQLVALCDADDGRAADTYNAFPDVPRFRDYRVMLDKMDKDIDAVMVCTPDHMHFPIALWALSKGKHVYCEKPLVRTVWECRKIREAAKKAGVTTQMGNQGHTNNGWRIIKEWNEDGLLGKISDVYASTDRPWWPQGALTPSKKDIPEGLDWKLWLGVAPHQDFADKIVPFDWRGLRNYGTGSAGDMACHILDAAISGLDLNEPVKIWGECSETNDYSWAQQNSVHLECKSKFGKDGTIKLHWYDGGLKPENIERISAETLASNQNYSYIVGDKETVITDCYEERPMLSSRELMIDLKKQGRFDAPSRIAESDSKGNPQQEWVNASIAGKQSMSNFDYAAPFTEMALLLTIASSCPEPVEYDVKNMKFKNFKEGDKRLNSMYKYNKEFLPYDVKQPAV